MYQFFVDPEQVKGEQILILGADVNHIRNVLRMKTGERIRISSGQGDSWFCTIASIGENEVWADIQEYDQAGTELPVEITLYQGLPKADKMELIIQKSVELGVGAVVPVAMKNCVMKLDEKKTDSKIRRWQAISESAAKQSKRTVIPEIRQPLGWKLALKEALKEDVLLIPYENERGMEATREIIRTIKPGQHVGIMIGPEGGFSSNEIEQIRQIKEEKGHEGEKVNLVSLGRRILRTETAGPAALAILVYELDQ